MTAEIIQKELLNLSIKNKVEINQNSFVEERNHLKSLILKYESLGFNEKVSQTKTAIHKLECENGKLKFYTDFIENLLKDNVSISDINLSKILKKYKLQRKEFRFYQGDIPEFNLDKIINYNPFYIKLHNQYESKNRSYNSRYFGFYECNHFPTHEFFKITDIRVYNEKLSIVADENSFIKEIKSIDPIVVETLEFCINEKYNFKYHIIVTMWGAEQVLPEIAEFYKHQN